MTNLYQAQQRAGDVRREREAEARIRRLRKAGRESAQECAHPDATPRRIHLAFTFRRHSLAPR